MFKQPCLVRHCSYSDSCATGHGANRGRQLDRSQLSSRNGAVSAVGQHFRRWSADAAGVPRKPISQGDQHGVDLFGTYPFFLGHEGSTDFDFGDLCV